MMRAGERECCFEGMPHYSGSGLPFDKRWSAPFWRGGVFDCCGRTRFHFAIIVTTSTIVVVLRITHIIANVVVVVVSACWLSVVFLLAVTVVGHKSQ